MVHIWTYAFDIKSVKVDKITKYNPHGGIDCHFSTKRSMLKSMADDVCTLNCLLGALLTTIHNYSARIQPK